jgi:NADPH-dependent glutamate synthase beta subunit-like oxidoreductase
LLRSAIPATRLPRDVLNAELTRLLALEGLTLHTSTRLGRDVLLDELQKKYAAVILSPGCQAAWDWDVRGAVPGELHEGLHLLKEFMNHGAFPEAKNVVVHGGGNTAIDICRLLKRSGAAHVTLVTASALPGPDTDPSDLINVVPRELTEAQEEGIEIIEHATINRLILRSSKTTGVEIASLRKIKGEDGRKRRVTFEGTERILEADMVVPCIGEKVEPEGLESLLNGGAYFSPEDESGQLNGSTVYALGDARGDRGTVAGAIGDGMKAVAAIAENLRRAPDAEPENRPALASEKLNTIYFESTNRTAVPSLPVSQRGFDTEIEGDIGRAAALAEAARCMSCGNCLACDNCWTLCPDSAVLKTREVSSDGSHYVFDLDYCKGCGICAAECPSGYIQMVAEE